MPICLREAGGKTCVVVVCDVCGEQIEDVGAGCYLWDMNETADGRSCQPLFAHRGTCFHTKLLQLQARGRLVGDCSLKAFVIYLLANLDVDPNKKIPIDWLRSAALFGL